MPELAEVEWFRKQWDVGRGAAIVDLSLHARNRVFRGSDVRDLLKINRREPAQLTCARQTDALQIFRRKLARHPSRNDR